MSRGYVFLNGIEEIRNTYLVAKGGQDKRNWGQHQYYALGSKTVTNNSTKIAKITRI